MCENIVHSFRKNDNVFKNSVLKALKGFLFLICCIFLFTYLYLKYFRRTAKATIIWCKRMFVECWIPLGSLLFNLKKKAFSKSESQLNADLCIYTRVSVTVKIMKYQIFSIVKFLDKQTKIQPKRCIHWTWAANFFIILDINIFLFTTNSTEIFRIALLWAKVNKL